MHIPNPTAFLLINSLISSIWFFNYYDTPICVSKYYKTRDNILNMTKVALVTGSSSGIGYETALPLARNGFDTFATMRNMNKSKEITEVSKKEDLPLKVMQLDVNDDRSVADAINNILNEKKSIEVVVNNAGYGLMGSVEDSSLDEIKAQFDTNFFGAIRVIKEVIPIMRKQRTGTIVNVSSVAGRIGFPMGSAYVSSKFALEGLSDRYHMS